MLRLKPGREKSLRRLHPWVFSGAIDRVEGAPGTGDVVPVVSADGEALAHAGFSPRSQIRARVWSWVAEERVDAGFIARRIEAAAARRSGLAGGEHGALRLVNAEADALPGLVVDRYADVAVMQISSAAAERWRDAIADAVKRLAGVRAVYERSDADVRELEGLPPRAGPVHGMVSGPVGIVEAQSGYAARFEVDVVSGHKTGFYLDQRANRALVARFARDAEVLNCFAYTGGFAIHAALAGARHVTSVESSRDALAQGARHAMLNDVAARTSWVEADVFQELRRLRDAGRAFDLIVLDPPKFAPTQMHVERAARAYKDINLLAFKLLRPGGVLATFSCSGLVDSQLLRKIVAGAAQDANADAEVMEAVGAAADHSTLLSFPEGEYLKGLLLRRR